MRRLLSSFMGRGRDQSLDGLPVCPQPQDTYVLITSDMVHFDLLDGDEECGGVEMVGAVGEPERWAVHVYGVDMEFPSLSKARAWLGKTRVEVEPA